MLVVGKELTLFNVFLLFFTLRATCASITLVMASMVSPYVSPSAKQPVMSGYCAKYPPSSHGSIITFSKKTFSSCA